MYRNDPGAVLAMTAGRRLALSAILVALFWVAVFWAL